MKSPILSFISILLICALLFSGCAQFASIQNNAGVQAAETAAIDIGLSLATKSPAFSFVAPIAVNGLTALANGSNPTAVTGSNVAADATLITQTVAAAIPNSTGKTIATQIATAFTTAMAAPGVPQTTTGANAVIGAIASGLTTGAQQAVPTQASNVHHRHFMMALPEIEFYFDLEQQSRVRFRSDRQIELREDEAPVRRLILV